MIEVDSDGKISKYKGTTTELVLPLTVVQGGATITVTGIRDAVFKGNNTFTILEIPEGFPDIPDGAFENCTSLTTVHLNAKMTKIAPRAFYGCTKLTSVGLASASAVTEIGAQAFGGCTSLKISAIPSKVTKIGSAAFENCTSIVDLDLASATSLKTIEGEAFQGCSGIREIILPDNVTNVGQSAFSGCKAATTLKISGGMKKIENYVFQNCSSLKTVAIPNTITSIGTGAFEGCSALDWVFIPTSVTEILDKAFRNVSAGTVLFMTGITTIDIRDSAITTGIICGNVDKDPHNYQKKHTAVKFVSAGALDYVIRCYKYLLNRSADWTEKAYWIRKLANGTTAAQMVKEFADSDECAGLSKNWSASDWVDKLYNVMLNRAKDGPAETWVEALDAGMSRDYVIKGIATSDEHKDKCNNVWVIAPGTLSVSNYRDKKLAVTKFVKNAYAWAFYKGDASKVSVSQIEEGCKNLLKSKKKWSAYKFVHTLLTSKTFKKQKTSKETYVTRLYQIYLMRTPSTSEKNKWVKKLKKKSRTWVESGFATSKEFKKKAKKWGIKNK